MISNLDSVVQIGIFFASTVVIWEIRQLRLRTIDILERVVRLEVKHHEVEKRLLSDLTTSNVG